MIDVGRKTGSAYAARYQVQCSAQWSCHETMVGATADRTVRQPARFRASIERRSRPPIDGSARAEDT